MTNEQIIAGFLQTAYSDEKLAALLAHAEDGKLSWHSCCCLRGIPTANHALRGINAPREAALPYNHGDPVTETDAYIQADRAFMDLAGDTTHVAAEQADALRRAAIIPIIKAEIARRDRERTESVESESLPPALVTLGVNG